MASSSSTSSRSVFSPTSLSSDTANLLKRRRSKRLSKKSSAINYRETTLSSDDSSDVGSTDIPRLKPRLLAPTAAATDVDTSHSSVNGRPGPSRRVLETDESSSHSDAEDLITELRREVDVYRDFNPDTMTEQDKLLAHDLYLSESDTDESSGKPLASPEPNPQEQEEAPGQLSASPDSQPSTGSTVDSGANFSPGDFIELEHDSSKDYLPPDDGVHKARCWCWKCVSSRIYQVDGADDLSDSDSDSSSDKQIPQGSSSPFSAFGWPRASTPSSWSAESSISAPDDNLDALMATARALDPALNPSEQPGTDELRRDCEQSLREFQSNIRHEWYSQQPEEPIEHDENSDTLTSNSEDAAVDSSTNLDTRKRGHANVQPAGKAKWMRASSDPFNSSDVESCTSPTTVSSSSLTSSSDDTDPNHISDDMLTTDYLEYLLQTRDRQDGQFDTSKLPNLPFDKIFTRDEVRGVGYKDYGRMEMEHGAGNSSDVHHYPSTTVDVNNPDDIFSQVFVQGHKHQVVAVYQRKMWKLMSDMFEQFTGVRPDSYQRMKGQLLDTLPKIKFIFTCREKATGEIHRSADVAWRRKKFPADEFDLVYCEAKTDLKELLKFHANLHHGDVRDEYLNAIENDLPIEIYFYVDGVQPTTSGTNKMLCQALRLPKCRKLLNYTTILYAKDHKLTANQVLQSLIHDLIHYPNIKVKLMVADLPERCRLAGWTSFNGTFGCMTCLSPGEPRPGGGGVIWPLWTTSGAIRDQISFHELAAETVETGVSTGGSKEMSPLLKIEGFDIPLSLAIDPMHLFMGLSKGLWEGFGNKYMSKRDFEDFTNRVSDHYTNLKVPKDFKRKPRPIDVPKFKANEWKQLILLCGLSIAQEYENLRLPEVALFWRRYTYIMRCLAQGNVWFKECNFRKQNAVKAHVVLLTAEVEKLLGREACTPNLHQLYHLVGWRERFSLSDLTAEVAEDFYGENRRSLRETAPNIPKQVMINTMVSAKAGHSCKTNFKVESPTSENSRGHIMVTSAREAFVIVGEDRDPTFYQARRIICMDYLHQDYEFYWSRCGVFRVKGMEEKIQRVMKSTLIARAIVNDANILLTWTRDMQNF